MISSRLPGRDSLLFVYGPLRPFVAIRMARWLAAEAHYVGPARARGCLYDLGPYPAMHARIVGGDYRRHLERADMGTNCANNPAVMS